MLWPSFNNMTKIMNYSTTSTSVALGFFIHLDHPLSKLSFELKLIINFSFLDKIRLMHLFWCFAPLLNRWWNTWKAFEVPQRFVPQLMPLLPSLFAVLTFMSVTWNERTLTIPWIPLIDSPALPKGNLLLLIHNNKLPQSLILYWLLSVVHCINPIVSTTVKPALWIINGHISKASCHFHYRWGTILIVVLYYTKMGCGLVAEDGGFVLS